ncbi:MAG: hypothetical protein NVS9B8_01700 [Candidatus Limnocylindrales bacterium]
MRHNRAMATRGTGQGRSEVAVFLTVFMAMVAIGLVLIRPFRSAPIAFDTAASVLHFERIVAGRHLEALITTTPKPLLTVIDGLLYSVGGDWRPVVWATIAAAAAAAAITAVVALRTDGWLAAGAVASGLAGSSTLWRDIGVALAVAWAILGLAIAAAALTACRPRHGLAGLALLAASLARIEVLTLVPIAAVALLLDWRRRPGTAQVPARPSGRPRRAWLIVAIPLLALPIMLLHDWLLTGNPLFWTEVAQRYSAAVQAPILTPLQMIRAIALHFAAEPAQFVLGMVGLAVLGRGRWPVLALGLGGLILGVAGLLVALATRHLYVPPRYFVPIDVGLVVAAGFAVAAIARVIGPPLRSRIPPNSLPSSPSVRAVSTFGLGILLALVGGWRPAILDGSLRTDLRNQARLAAHYAAVLPAMRTSLTEPPSAGPPAPPSGSGPGAPPRLSVPVALQPAAIVDTGLTIGEVAVNRPSTLGPVGRSGPAIVFHDRLGDLPSRAYAGLEIAVPTRVGSVDLRPLTSRPGLGFWLLEIAPAP